MKPLIFQVDEGGLEDDKPNGFSILMWLKRDTKRELRKKFIFKVALKKARNGNVRAGKYLKRKYGLISLCSEGRVFVF